MAGRLTNKMLNQLLSDLGFQVGELTSRNHRVWQHPESGCTLLLPDNKSLQAPRPADLVAFKAHLSLQGHLDEEDFDFFIAEGKLPDPSSVRE